MKMVPTLRVLVYVFLCVVFIFQDENLALSFGVCGAVFLGSLLIPQDPQGWLTSDC